MPANVSQAAPPRLHAVCRACTLCAAASCVHSDCTPCAFVFGVPVHTMSPCRRLTLTLHTQPEARTCTRSRTRTPAPPAPALPDLRWARSGRRGLVSSIAGGDMPCAKWLTLSRLRRCKNELESRHTRLDMYYTTCSHRDTNASGLSSCDRGVTRVKSLARITTAHAFQLCPQSQQMAAGPLQRTRHETYHALPSRGASQAGRKRLLVLPDVSDGLSLADDVHLAAADHHLRSLGEGVVILGRHRRAVCPRALRARAWDERRREDTTPHATRRADRTERQQAFRFCRLLASISFLQAASKRFVSAGC